MMKLYRNQIGDLRYADDTVLSSTTSGGLGNLVLTAKELNLVRNLKLNMRDEGDGG